MFLTKSHSAALESIVAMGELYFSRESSLVNLKPKLFPLIIGPTGSGKSFLFEHASTLLKADYFRVQRGDWIPTRLVLAKHRRNRLKAPTTTRTMPIIYVAESSARQNPS